LIGAFRAVFSDGYKELIAAVATMQAALSERFGEPALARLDAVSEQDNATIEFWTKYCAFDAIPLRLPAELIARAQALGAAARRLNERKAAGPLEAIARILRMMSSSAPAPLVESVAARCAAISGGEFAFRAALIKTFVSTTTLIRDAAALRCAPHRSAGRDRTRAQRAGRE
jgi:hypothetical protein